MPEQGSGSATGQESGSGATGLGNDSQSSGNASTANPPAGNQGNNGNSGSTDISALLTRMSSLEEQVKEIPKLRAEAAKYRTRLKALASEDESQGKESGNAVDPEMAKSIQALREGRIRDQLTLAATAANAHAPQDIYRYVDMASVASEDGTVDKPDKLMEDLRKSHPYLFKPPVQGSADGQSGSGNQGKPGDMNTIIRQGFRSLRGNPIS